MKEIQMLEDSYKYFFSRNLLSVINEVSRLLMYEHFHNFKELCGSYGSIALYLTTVFNENTLLIV